MSKENFHIAPKKHILAYDGMSITADVWEEAHSYHALTQNAHQAYLHGTGIVVGLEVIASDPPDHVVFVLPGIAIDSAGKMIVLTEPVAYDFGENISGKLRLTLLHREIKLQQDPKDENNTPAYMQDEYVIVARAEAVDLPHVEIARIFRDAPTAPIVDAANPLAPRANEIDLRFRLNICPPPVEQVLAGVVYLGDVADKYYDQALNHLADPLRRISPYQLIVENDVPLKQDALQYGLIYLVVGSSPKLNKTQTEILQAHLQNGGKLLVEMSEDNPQELLKPLGIPLAKIPATHAVYQSPNLFLFPPTGSAPAEKTQFWSGEPGLFCASGGFGVLWSGQVRQPAFTREVVRSAIEWGVNILSYLLAS